MSQKLPVNVFEWMKNLLEFNEDFIKEYGEKSNTGYVFEVDLEYPKTLFNFDKNLPFLSERKKIAKVEKLICSIEDKEKYVLHIRALKQARNYGLKLKTLHRLIQFYQKGWLKPYIDMNTELRKNAKKEFEKNLFQLMNNSVFGKTLENVRNHKDIKLVTSNKRRKRLVSEPNYYSHKTFSNRLMAIEMKKTWVKMIKSLYLRVSILNICKTFMNFGLITLNQNMEIGQNCVTRILIALLFTLKLKIFLKILLMMLRDCLIHLTMMKKITDFFQ